MFAGDHPDVALSLNNLAALYYDKEQYTEAEFLLQQALELYKRLLGEENPDVAQSLNNLVHPDINNPPVLATPLKGVASLTGVGFLQRGEYILKYGVLIHKTSTV